MKTILIAATIAGMAGAAVILYLRNRNSFSSDANKVIDAADDAYKTMNKHMKIANRPAQHSMG